MKINGTEVKPDDIIYINDGPPVRIKNIAVSLGVKMVNADGTEPTTTILWQDIVPSMRITLAREVFVPENGEGEK